MAFANSLPRCVSSNDRYTAGSASDREAVRERVARVIAKVRPGKTILFSRKAWSLWPALNGSQPEAARLLSDDPDIPFGTYTLPDRSEVLAYNLPHPLFQNGHAMKARVARILAHTI